jgi:Leucine-rich repeat (LRR) protein
MLTQPAGNSSFKRSRTASLQLSGTRTTDEGLREVARFSGLKYLDLSDTQITDDGLAHLRELKELRAIYLSNTAITDVGLRHLAELPQLENFDIDGTRVKLDIEQILSLFPNVKSFGGP